MILAEPLAGLLRLRPGHPRPHNLRSTRPELVGRCTTGVAADRLPALLGSLFSLCGQAHRLCAGLAVQAARGEPVAADGPALEAETLRQHLRRIWLDWPRLLGDGAADVGDLARSPPLDQAGPWLATQVFGMPPADWLRGWAGGRTAWLGDWCDTTETLPARLLRNSRAVASDPIEAAPPLRPHASAESMCRLAADDTLPGSPRAESGTWTRLHATDPPPGNAWLRLGSRLAEIARLAQHEQPLARGALPLADGAALAWVEMARGLLIHRVRLDGRGAVAACRVIAPTDWNFHPDGAVAGVLETTAAHDLRRIGALFAAYDPCVPYRIDPAAQPEAADA